MSKILNKEITKNILSVDCFVDNKEYEKNRNAIIDDYIKNIKIDGYRKGKAPRQRALKEIDESSLTRDIEATVINMALLELSTEVDSLIEQEGRIKTYVGISADPEHTKKVEDGFQFRLVIKLLPKIDLSLLSKVKIVVPQAEKIEGRMTKKEFFDDNEKQAIFKFNDYTEADLKSKEGLKVTLNVTEKILDSEKEPVLQEGLSAVLGLNKLPAEFEKNIIGLKKGGEKEFEMDISQNRVKYNVEIVKIEKPKYKTLEEVFNNSDEFQQEFESLEYFKKDLEGIYDKETIKIYNEIKETEIVKQLNKIFDFDVETELLETETERILNSYREDAIKDEKTLVEAFQGSIFLTEPVKTDQDVENNIRKYVESELKLTDILQVIYYEKIEEEKQVKTEEIDALYETIKQNPARFSILKEQEDILDDKERLRDYAFNLMSRSIAFDWLKNEIKYEIAD